MSDKLNTPFGELEIKLNGKSYDYQYKIVKRNLIEENIDIDVYLVEIDFSNCKINDTLECYIKNCKLEYYDGDERCDLLTKVENNIALGVCGYEPQYHESERLYHCYELYDYSDGNFIYKVYRNPKEYDKDEFKESCITKVEICWLNQNEFKNAEATLFDVLC